MTGLSSAVDRKRSISKLERAVIELRTGMLGACYVFDNFMVADIGHQEMRMRIARLRQKSYSMPTVENWNV